MGIDIYVPSAPRNNQHTLLMDKVDQNSGEAAWEEAWGLACEQEAWFEKRFGAHSRRLNRYVEGLLEHVGYEFLDDNGTITLMDLMLAAAIGRHLDKYWDHMLVNGLGDEFYPYRDAVDRLDALIESCEMWGDKSVYYC